jgi:menaquinone-dependent protoporphyrinogen IX oxidase
MNIQIIYYSKYGATKEIAYAIGKRLGTNDISDVMDLKKITGDMVIVGSAIYAEVSHKDITRLLKDTLRKLRDRPVALFAVCLAKKIRKMGEVEVGGPVYLRKMESALGRPPLAVKIFGGRALLENMDEEERKRTTAFYEKHGMSFVAIDMMSESEVEEFVEDIRGKLNFHRSCSVEGSMVL